MDQAIMTLILNYVVKYASSWLMTVMVITFFLGVIMRALIWLTVNCEFKWSAHFEKLTKRYLIETHEGRETSFHRLTKYLLNRTQYEFFEAKRIHKRRNLDYITTIIDRLFIFEEGGKRLILDTLDQTRYLSKTDKQQPRLVEVSKWAFDRNHIFHKVWGIFPIGIFNDFLGILPGLFVIAGILGTFIGISRGLPELSGMDIANLAESKHVLDLFLLKVGHSMVTSVLGILLSVSMSIINTAWSTEGLFFKTINLYTGSLEYIWNETQSNVVDSEDNPFEHARIEQPPELPPTGKNGTIGPPLPVRKDKRAA
jgi:hypothetical protein